MIKPNTIENTDAVTYLNALPPRSVDSIITDTPYYRVKGDFDRKWTDRDEFMADARRWADAMERVLKPNGSLIWFCSDTMLGHIISRSCSRINLGYSILAPYSNVTAYRTHSPNLRANALFFATTSGFYSWLHFAPK